MKVELVFGDKWIDVTLPETTRLIKPDFSIPIEPVQDLSSTIREALRNPYDAKPLKDFVKPHWKITIAFDDPTVPCYAPIWETAISAILEELSNVGVNKSQITLLCANALHRKFRLSELETILGTAIVNEFKDRIVCHDAEDPSDIVYLGKTCSGYDVEINRRVVDSDLTIYVNTVSTGFNGGWKSICVGLSTWRSIRWHHTPEIMTMSLVKNPMHEILNEMGALVVSKLGQEKIFKIDTVLANPFEAARIWAGTVEATRRKALEFLKAHIQPRRQAMLEKADIICYGIPDWSPYAAFGSMTPLLTVISTGLGYLGGMIEAVGKPGCSVVIATPCPNQWDDIHHPTHREIWDHVLTKTLDPNEIMHNFSEQFATRTDYIAKYRFEYAFHPVHGILVLHPLKRLKHVGQVFIAGAQDPELVEHLGFIWTKTVEDAIEKAQLIHGKGALVACVQYPMMYNRQ